MHFYSYFYDALAKKKEKKKGFDYFASISSMVELLEIHLQTWLGPEIIRAWGLEAKEEPGMITPGPAAAATIRT